MNTYINGSALREIRNGLRISQEKLARLTNLSTFTISRWESGYRSECREWSLAAVAEALNVDASDLRGIKPNEDN